MFEIVSLAVAIIAAVFILSAVWRRAGRPRPESKADWLDRNW